MAERRSPSPEEVGREQALLNPSVASNVGVSVEELTELLLLDALKGFGPQKFKELHEAGVSAGAVLANPALLPLRGKTGDKFRRALAALGDEAQLTAHARAVRQLVRAQEHDAKIVTYQHPLYPSNVYESNNPIPILYVRGNASLLSERRVVACVGSRETREPYSDRHHEFATHAVARGFSIASGFALGADTIGHRAAYEAEGTTVLVMPSGLDRPFPPENRGLWEELLRYPRAVMVSEFGFGTSTSALTLRKRNKLIVAFARGVLLSQTSAKGGAMNAYRFAVEQHKPVATFAPDGQGRTSGNLYIAEDRPPQLQVGSHSDGANEVFSANAPSPDAWDSWLQRLSSST
jgi:DNA processing protein